jgi:serine protease inhibitor
MWIPIVLGALVMIVAGGYIVSRRRYYGRMFSEANFRAFHCGLSTAIKIAKGKGSDSEPSLDDGSAFVTDAKLAVGVTCTTNEDGSQQNPSRQHQFTQLSGFIINLAFELYHTLSIPGNFIFSPLGLYCALGMLFEGARGSTRDALSALLGHDAHVPLAPVLKALLDKLHTRTQLTPYNLQSLQHAEAERRALVDRGEWREELADLYGTATAEDVRLDLAIANGMWIQNTYPCRPEFVEILQAGMAAEVAHLDFEGQPAQASRIINAWVHNKTRGRIPAMLSPSDLSPLTRALLANALYFKARWDTEFASPEPGPFYLLDGTPVQAQMMTRVFWGLNYMDMGDFWMVELPYYQQPISLIILVPSARGATALLSLEQQLRPSWSSAQQRLLRGRRNGGVGVSLTMPEFRIKAQHELAPALSQLGLHQMFDEGADFSGVSDEPRFHINRILQNAFISVDQYGTEAAAVTMVEMEGAAFPPKEQVTRTIDQPFLFAIVDKPSDVILFLGKVVNPTQENP